MPLVLDDLEEKTREAVRVFWGNRERATQKQIAAGKADRGGRSAVTGGKNLDGFTSLVCDIVKDNGLSHAAIHRTKGVVTLPGYFRPTKLWDIVVIDKEELIAVVEFKSHVGPDFGKNSNNRAEEAIGNAHDLLTAFREGAFGRQQPRPFIGWLMFVEDDPATRKPLKDMSRHYPIFPEFRGASYLTRYDLLCQRLVTESLYTAACTMTSKRSAFEDGSYADASELTSFRTFIATLAGHCAAAAVRLE